ncbi:MAG TPA: transglycosylase domain-containing protein [Acidimicrobiales bacterium]
MTTRRRGPLWRWRRLLLLLGLAAITLASGAGVLLANVGLPPEAFQPESTIIFDAQGRRMGVLHAGENRTAVELGEVPRIVRDAILATEDRSFYAHSGLDPWGIARATVADLRAGSAVQGGSTITQQYVKNVYVGSDRTLWRKLREAALSVKLERKLSKDEILERYLNTIYWGRGAYGIQAAAKAWFDRDVTQLGLPEAAYLAGLIRAPETADVSRHPERAEDRRESALDAMVDAGVITADDRIAVLEIPLTDSVVDRASSAPQVVGSEWGTDYIVEWVRQELGERFSAATVTGGGLRVFTTIDLDLQRHAAAAVGGVLDQPDDPDAALVSLDGEGRVVALIGGRDWEASKVNLALGTDGGGAGRQAGSAFKPFALAEALRQGWSVESTFGSPTSIVLPGADDGRDWTVNNYDDASHGTINLVEATRVSSNTVYAQLVDLIGADEVTEFAGLAGVTAELPPVSSIALGTGSVSVLDMASGYSTFARGGVAIAPSVIERVETADGGVIFQRRPQATQVLTANEADTVTWVLEQAVRSGTGRGAALDDQVVAGKTGTTQGYGDAWFIGYTRHLTTAVWMGYAEGQSRAMTSVRGRAVTGGSFPAQIFQRFMAVATQRFEPRAFPTPELGGRVHGEAQPYVDPSQRTTTTTEPPTTTTLVPPPSPPTSSTSVAPTGSSATTSSSSPTSQPVPTSTPTGDPPEG